MSDEPNLDFRQDIVDAEYGSGHAALGPTGGQVAFDVFFGVLAPIALLMADPALFPGDPPLFVADRAALPPYWATPTYILVGSLVAALLAWGLTGMRRPVLGMALAGPFAAGAILFFLLGAVLFFFALGHADLLSGWLALTPWATAFVFARHCVLACRAGASRSVPLTVLLLVASFAGLSIGLTSLATARDRRARLLESMLLSESPADLAHALARIRHRNEVDMDRVALAYLDMGDSDARRPRLKEAYQRITGSPIEAALQRLLPPTAPIPGQQEPPSQDEKEEERTPAALDHLFSKDWDEHEKASESLFTHTPDQKVLDEIALRYAALPEGDRRREWIAKAYRILNSDGETIERALKRLSRPATPREKSPFPPKTPAGEP